jgi:hypothetical protein
MESEFFAMVSALLAIGCSMLSTLSRFKAKKELRQPRTPSITSAAKALLWFGPAI